MAALFVVIVVEVRSQGSGIRHAVLCFIYSAQEIKFDSNPLTTTLATGMFSATEKHGLTPTSTPQPLNPADAAELGSIYIIQET